jgi:predicted O-methyltransferase YrrM
MNSKIIHFSNKVARKAQKAADTWAMDYWHDYPFGRQPRASKERYMELWEEAKAQKYPEIDAYEKESGHKLKTKWLNDLALHTQIVVKDSNLCYQHGRVLYSALSTYLENTKANQSITILETGTARGFSATIMASALKDAKRFGKIITFDLLPHTTKMFWNCIDDHEGPKTRQELLSPWKPLIDEHVIFIENDSRIGLARTAMGRINFAFLDGAHTYDDVMMEFGTVIKAQEKGDVIIFDDYNEELFPGIVKAVDEGCVKWGYNKVVLRSRDARAYVIATKK